MNPSGGLRWHWRAWRSQNAWRVTCGHIASWLAQVQPQASELIVIGGSAGWMMSPAWLQTFKKVTVWDIDRLAKPLFNWRHGAALKASGTALVFHRGDALAQLPRILNTNPKACVFFDNLLGQLRFHDDNFDRVSQKLAQTLGTLKGREWGSLHDAYSGPVSRAQRGLPLPAMQIRKQGAPDAETADQDWLLQMGAQGEWLDHLSTAIFEKDTLVHHIAWPYQPHYWHGLKAGWVRG
jgi:hypothetical protein